MKESAKAIMESAAKQSLADAVEANNAAIKDLAKKIEALTALLKPAKGKDKAEPQPEADPGPEPK